MIKKRIIFPDVNFSPFKKHSKTKKLIIADMMDLRPLGGGGGGRGEGFPSAFLAGVCGSVLQTLNLCQTKIRNFQVPNIVNYFQFRPAF